MVVERDELDRVRAFIADRIGYTQLRTLDNVIPRERQRMYRKGNQRGWYTYIGYACGESMFCL